MIDVFFLNSSKGFDLISCGTSRQIFGPQQSIDFFPGFRSNFRLYVVAFIGVSGVIIVCPIYSFKIFEI